MAYCQDQGEVYLIHHQIASLRRSLTKKFVVKSLRMEVSLFEIACMLPFSGETSWLKKKLRPVLSLWSGSRGGLSDSPSNGISSKKSRIYVCCEIVTSGSLFIGYSFYINPSRWNTLVKEETKTILWLMVKIEGRFIWFSIKWYLFKELS